ncbi:MAG: NADH-quinone oxidoreductase subunit A [Chloroflexi bacterium]|nr:NADH-quinone oxidoreductase subunit A [Chloroflexota bacterium]MBI3741697.1 NADH-quinone oxidoreductase subunit A [Chloroflexota bacterium]
MLDRYGLLGLFAIAALTFPLVPIILAGILGPKKPNKAKLTTYECGLEFEDFPEEAQQVWVQFRVQYYIYALIFVVFDIEVVFLYPWAVAYNALGLFAAVEMAIFIGVLVLALAYAWRKGLLEWI